MEFGRLPAQRLELEDVGLQLVTSTGSPQHAGLSGRPQTFGVQSSDGSERPIISQRFGQGTSHQGPVDSPEGNHFYCPLSFKRVQNSSIRFIWISTVLVS